MFGLFKQREESEAPPTDDVCSIRGDSLSTVRVKTVSSGAYDRWNQRVEELEALVKQQRGELELTTVRQAEYESQIRRQREEN